MLKTRNTSTGEGLAAFCAWEVRGIAICEFYVGMTPSFSVGRYGWGTGVDLCVPMEVRIHADGVALIALTRRLLTRQTTCAAEFAGYQYGKADWLREAGAREMDIERRRKQCVDS
ncbi:MAG: hypothetical protein H7232_08305 [Aeromicrobium sp.]|nr:hypothetical protein [Burkholderiales bacterium]